MSLISLFLVLHMYTITLQNKGGVRTKTTIEARSNTEAKRLANQLYKNQIVISVVLKK
jgi:hypothetical protein